MSLRPPPLHISFSNPVHSEANFRRFEHDLFIALQNHPRETIYTPIHISPSTFLPAFRSCIKAYLHPACPWTSTLVPKHKLATVRAEFVLRIENNKQIYFGPPNKVPLAPTGVQRMNSSSTPINDIIDGTDVELVRSIVVVKSRGIIDGQLTISDLATHLADELEASFPNLTFVPVNPAEGLYHVF